MGNRNAAFDELRRGKVGKDRRWEGGKKEVEKLRRWEVEKDGGALCLLNTLFYKIRCEIPLVWEGRNGLITCRESVY